MTTLSPAEQITLDRLRASPKPIAWHDLHHIAAHSLVQKGLAETTKDEAGVRVFSAKED
jgi:hypothetical protein